MAEKDGIKVVASNRRARHDYEILDQVEAGLVDDDGVGATVPAGRPVHDRYAPDGRGIAGMRERALALGGTLEAGPRAWRFVLDVFPDLCVLGFAVFLLVQGIDDVRAGVFRTATNSRINMAFVYAAIPLFAALTVAYSALNLVGDYRTFRSGGTTDRRPPAAE